MFLKSIFKVFFWGRGLGIHDCLQHSREVTKMADMSACSRERVNESYFTNDLLMGSTVAVGLYTGTRYTGNTGPYSRNRTEPK